MNKIRRDVKVCYVPRCDEAMAQHMPIMNFPKLWKEGEYYKTSDVKLLGNCNHNCWECFCNIVRYGLDDVHLPVSLTARRGAKKDTNLAQKGDFFNEFK